MRKTRVIGLFWLFWLLGLWQAAVAAQPALPVAQAQYRSAAAQQVFDGVIEAVKQSTVSAQISGRVQEIAVDVNDRVAKGAVLVRVQDVEPRARLSRDQAAVSEAQARYQQAQQDFERTKAIYERRLIAKAEMDRATATLDAARARLDAAQAQATESRQQFHYAVVSAPYNGIVTKRHVEVGEAVQPGQPLIGLQALDRLRVSVDVPQSLVKAVRARGRVRVILPDAAGAPRTLELAALTVFPYADPQTDTVRVRADLPDALPGVYPGLFVKAAFPLDEEKSLAVPERAVVRRSEVTGVYVVDGRGGVSLRQIRAGKRYDDGMIEVLAGLDEGEHVALDPVRAVGQLKQQRAGKP
ncbi:MAG: efflux RND transporter periplasmic adaptor subunit [Pseudomonadota bacterium]